MKRANSLIELITALQPSRLPNGTRVRTTQPDPSVAEKCFGQRTGTQWGVEGVVVADSSDLDGVCYDVRHDDGAIITYEPAELEVIQD